MAAAYVDPPRNSAEHKGRFDSGTLQDSKKIRKGEKRNLKNSPSRRVTTPARSAFFSGDGARGGGALPWGTRYPGRSLLTPRLPRAHAPARRAGRDAEEDGERGRSDRGGQAAHRLVGALRLRHLLLPHA